MYASHLSSYRTVVPDRHIPKYTLGNLFEPFVSVNHLGYITICATDGGELPSLNSRFHQVIRNAHAEIGVLEEN